MGDPVARCVFPVRAAVAALVLAFPVVAAAADPKDATQRDGTVFLPGGLPDAPSMPPCTPLRVKSGGSGAAKTTLVHVYGRWGPFELQSKALEELRRAPTLAECLTAVPQFAGRFTEAQIGQLETGRLAVGMPVEFALMSLGLPQRARPREAPAAGEAAKRSAEVSWERPWEFGTLRWESGKVAAFLDSTGHIEGLELLDESLPALFVSGDPERPVVSDRGSGVLALPADGEAHDEFARAVKAYHAGDLSGALETFRRLAEAGHPPSQYALGDMYYRGDGVEKDLTQAAVWIERAADSMLPGALYHLGLLRLQGEGLPPDPVAAYAAMSLAAALGNPDAQEVLDRLERRLTRAELDAAKKLADSTGVTPPSLIRKVEPEYPELARIARLEGRVVLQAVVRADGSVRDIVVLRSNRPNMGFEQAAIEALSRWRYEPARRKDNGKPVEVYFLMWVDFNLH